MSYNRTQRNLKYSSTTFYDDAPNSIGSMACIECCVDAFHVVKLNWGAEEDYERSRDGEVEQRWTVRGGALECLKKTCNNAKSQEAVVEYLRKRIAPFGRTAHYKLLNWLQKRHIPYTYTEY